MPDLLSIEDLSLGYNKKVIYKKINATASDGELIGVFGANGVGKSTLLRTIAGLQPIFSGKIILKGINYRKLKLKDIASSLSFVPAQMDRANNLSVFDMLGLNCYFRSNWLGKIEDKDKEMISNALKLVGLDNYGDKNSAELSDGEYQRATIAGALVKDCPIIIFDEPTAFLDIANKYQITELLAKIAQERGKTIIFSSHDLNLAIEYCDKIWLMGYESFYNEAPQTLKNCGAFNQLFTNKNILFDPISNTFHKGPQ
ncbi:MAG: ABC transporter ATP-binding protein [Bacteroidales bacterium]|nr:ABC transporter ATP-binding protein [Bacteroidales bacterium]